VSINKVSDLIDQMRVAADGGVRPGGEADREKLKQLAAQFESMLLVQMLRGMREAGKWDDEESESAGFDGSALFETIDAELANQLAASKGIGLRQQMLQAFEKLVPPGAPNAVTGNDAAAATATPVPVESKSAVSSEASAAPLDSAQGGPTFSVAPGSVTSDFGWRRDPFTGKAKFHRGIDVRAAYGEEVNAAGAGRIVFSGDQRGYGTTVVVEHGNGVRTRYAHLSAALVQEGDQVTPGQAIGRAGRSGRATGTHLHFEVTANGRAVDPAEWGLTVPDGVGSTD
jgi:murein DD-endopeptidase MepM/ murein hydrolase activator NlpD